MPTDGLPEWGQKNPNRGITMSVDPATGAYEVFAMGMREPNGLGVGPDGELFAPDVQGNWIAANKLNHVKKGRFYGFKHEPAETWDNMAISPPVVWLPEGEVSSAPGNPLFIETGKFAGQMLLGDVVVGGIRRIFVEKVGGEYQGSVFHFSGGLEGGVNRLLWGPDGHLYVGICGQGSGWSFKQDFGLQKIKSNGKAVFEMQSVRSRAGGMEIEYTEEIYAAAEDKAKYTVKTSQYISTSKYDSPPQAGKTLAVSAVQVSSDRKKVFLDVPGLEADRVVYFSIIFPAIRTLELVELPWRDILCTRVNKVMPMPTTTMAAMTSIMDHPRCIRARKRITWSPPSPGPCSPALPRYPACFPRSAQSWRWPWPMRRRGR